MNQTWRDSPPRVSVICTVRDGKRFLAQALDGVRGQSMREWELIVVDDGSTDGTPDFVRAHMGEDPRLRLICTDGIGRGPALNLALQHARAEWIANVDADDPMHPRRFELELEAVQRNPSFDVIATDSLLIEGDEEPNWPALPNVWREVIDVTGQLAYRNSVMHSSVLMRADALRRVGGYDATRRSQFDYDLWVRLAASGSRIGLLKLALAAKRKHPGQSFERRHRLRYLWRSSLVQLRAIDAVGAPRYMRAIVLGRFAYGLTPELVRSKLRKASPFGR